MFSGVGWEKWFASVEDDGGHPHPYAKEEADGVHDGNESVAATCPEVRSWRVHGVVERAMRADASSWDIGTFIKIERARWRES